MKKYEVMYIVDLANGEEAVKETVEKYNSFITSNATFESTDEWGAKRLAYEINKKHEGYYVLTQFDAEPTFPAELERLFKIDEKVMKYLVISKED